MRDVKEFSLNLAGYSKQLLFVKMLSERKEKVKGFFVSQICLELILTNKSHSSI